MDKIGNIAIGLNRLDSWVYHSDCERVGMVSSEGEGGIMQDADAEINEINQSVQQILTNNTWLYRHVIRTLS